MGQGGTHTTYGYRAVPNVPFVPTIFLSQSRNRISALRANSEIISPKTQMKKMKNTM